MWKYFAVKSIKRQFAKSRKKRAKHFVNYADASTIVVLADPLGAQESVSLLRSLQADGKKVVLYHFTMALQKTKIRYPDIETVEISLEDLCWGNNRPRKEVCQQFKALSPDVLIDLTTVEILPVAYLVAICYAPMRLGFQKESLVSADMMMQDETKEMPIDGLLRNLLFYWKNITAKEE